MFVQRRTQRATGVWVYAIYQHLWCTHALWWVSHKLIAESLVFIRASPAYDNVIYIGQLDTAALF